MRGRKPELKAIEGGLAKAPPAPSWLPTEAKSEWRRIWPGLAARRTVTREDLPVVESYVLALGMIRRCQAAIAIEGETIETSAGPKRHPTFQTMFQALTESRRLAAELGLTPASRNKAVARDPGDDDDLSGFDI